MINNSIFNEKWCPWISKTKNWTLLLLNSKSLSLIFHIYFFSKPPKKLYLHNLIVLIKFMYRIQLASKPPLLQKINSIKKKVPAVINKKVLPKLFIVHMKSYFPSWREEQSIHKQHSRKTQRNSHFHMTMSTTILNYYMYYPLLSRLKPCMSQSQSLSPYFLQKGYTHVFCRQRFHG